MSDMSEDDWLYTDDTELVPSRSSSLSVSGDPFDFFVGDGETPLSSCILYEPTANIGDQDVLPTTATYPKNTVDFNLSPTEGLAGSNLAQGWLVPPHIPQQTVRSHLPMNVDPNLKIIQVNNRASLNLLSCNLETVMAMRASPNEVYVQAESLAGERWYPCGDSDIPSIRRKGHYELYSDVSISYEQEQASISFKVVCKGPCDARRAGRLNGRLLIRFRDYAIQSEPFKILCNRSKGGIRQRDVDRHPELKDFRSGNN